MALISRMFPAPGEHLLRFVGDRLRVTLDVHQGIPPKARAFLRTNLTRAHEARREVIAESGLRSEDSLTFAGASWRDIPLRQQGETRFVIDLPLLEVGQFRCKAYWVDEALRQFWPEGGDVGITVHPDHLRTGNLIYCAFPRAFARGDGASTPASLQSAIEQLDQRGFTVIPPSGTLRNLTRELPHIFDTLGCRILHLLPVGPVPTTYARMGRFGSPYAQLDLTGIDPALVEFDKKTTAVDQFRELTDAVHLRDGLVILDIVLNHTGWGSTLLDNHSQWFQRDASGEFHSPGAWGNTWADLVELDQKHPELWDVLADALLVWCRRGVDGFRCDAGYMVPLPAWQYIVARVRDEFPECVFLLEGLGGAWAATEALLTRGGMQWAYSELFQCYEPVHVAHYLDHALAQSERIGVLTHYSETHDNDRLAKKGPVWSLMRNRLSALASHCGSFGFTCGVEWLSTQKIDVHEGHSLSWGQTPNLVQELRRLNALLREHPCFFDGASVRRVSAEESPVLALQRTSSEGSDACLVLVNLDAERDQALVLEGNVWKQGGEKHCDLLGQTPPAPEWLAEGRVRLSLQAGQSFCLSSHASPRGLSGDHYRTRRAQAAWAYTQLGTRWPHEALGPADFIALGGLAAEDPEAFLAATFALDASAAGKDLLAALEQARRAVAYRPVIQVRVEDARRITLVPPEHWLLVRDAQPFEIELAEPSGMLHLRSVAMDEGHVVAVPPRDGASERDVSLRIDRFGELGPSIETRLRRLAHDPAYRRSAREGLVLLTNGRGAMARMHADFGASLSKYDCLLGANLDPQVPTERWVLVKRARAWVNADGFITALDAQNLSSLEAGTPATWTFLANAGAGRRVGIRVTAEFAGETNCVLLRLERFTSAAGELPREARVHVTLRFDLEDRSMHGETVANPELEAHFARSTSLLASGQGFAFKPAPEREVRVSATAGSYHAGIEWTYGIVHAVEENRGMAARGDAYSPGWFEIPLTSGSAVTLRVDAEPGGVEVDSERLPAPTVSDDDRRVTHPFEEALREAARAFVVRRGTGKTVIAGYPWFLDWGRDTLIAARGLLRAGYIDDVREILLTFAEFERAGTLPNYLAGAGEGSRETSDAPMWFGLACEELASIVGQDVYQAKTDSGRTLGAVLSSMAEGYLRGTSNGVHVDLESGLVWSPPHFTWMDTNYPAATPREGYPIELSVMFARLLRQVGRIDAEKRAPFELMAVRTEASLASFYRPELGFCSDTLHAASGTPARAARPDDHLRPNQLIAVSLGVLKGAQARSIVQAVERYLLVPGALRSLAPLPVSFALPVRSHEGRSLNDAANPYWGHYEGDEDTRRKPAYHNGTAWGWWLPTYCEALALAYDMEPRAVDAARAVLGSTARLLSEGCLGQLPEILDGDAPHTQRGCDAQAWSATEALRVWLMLESAR
ncbi:MAG: amylo-alpha-1,6-glucosidase [Myxococcales bacterium]